MLSNIMDGVIYVQNQKFAVAEGDLYRFKRRLMQKRDLVKWLPLSSVIHLMPTFGYGVFFHQNKDKSLHYTVGKACTVGLLQACRALKLDTSWYETYWEVQPDNPAAWKRRHVLPLFLERLYETP